MFLFYNKETKDDFKAEAPSKESLAMRKKNLTDFDLVEKIKKLKKEKNAIVLAHCYQNVEIDLVADYVGDSLGLSRLASKTDADIIVFAGVYFMAETAKILSPDKKVLLPNKNSGCNMADMIDVQRIREFKKQAPNAPVVCYVNSTAEVKAECDVCCTSANAVQIVRSLNVPHVLFAPDCYLGNYVNKNLKDVEVISYQGYCPTHLRIIPDEIVKMKIMNKDAKLLVHPECHQEVVKLADFVGSTTQIMQYCTTSNHKQFIIATEKGVVDRLKRDIPDKEFILASPKLVCHNMKWNTLEDILNALERDEFEVTVKEEIRQKALKSIERMIELG